MGDGRDVFCFHDTIFRMQLINIYEHFRHIQRLASDWSLVLEGGGPYVSLVIFLVEFLPNLTGGFKYYVFFTSTWGNDPIWLIFFRWVVSIIYRLLSNPRTQILGPFAKDQEDLTKLRAEEAEKRRLERKAENQMVLEYKLES